MHFHIIIDVIKQKHFLRYWPFVRGIHGSPVYSIWCQFNELFMGLPLCKQLLFENIQIYLHFLFFCNETVWVIETLLWLALTAMVLTLFSWKFLVSANKRLKLVCWNITWCNSAKSYSSNKYHHVCIMSWGTVKQQVPTIYQWVNARKT